MRSMNGLIASALFVTIATVTGSAAGQCVGDCDGGASVTVSEVIDLVNIALGTQTESACPHGIPSGAEVTVALIIQAVNQALKGCAPAPADFQLHVAASVSVPRDSSGQLRVRIERKPGFCEPVEIDAMNAPDGVSAHAVIVSEDEAELPLNIAADVPIGPLDLTVVGRQGGAAATALVRIEVQEAQPRAQELIQAALDAGQIDLGTSLLYRAYATFGDARLPREFVGSGPLEEDAQLFLYVVDRAYGQMQGGGRASTATNGVPQYGSNSGATFGTITVTGNCTPDGTVQTESHPNSLIPWWNLPGTYDLKEMGTLMQEDISLPGGGSRNSWTLHKVTN